jgi:hypothetical protein
MLLKKAQGRKTSMSGRQSSDTEVNL